MIFLKKILRSLISWAGYQLIKKDHSNPYRLNLVKESIKNVGIVKEYTMLSFLKLATLYEQAVFLKETN